MADFRILLVFEIGTFLVMNDLTERLFLTTLWNDVSDMFFRKKLN
tara:strand:+ start:325 stop:459 length:135 start_codon:yes stop_codon:yes gene_type:complete